jgi:hypothetical protein
MQVCHDLALSSALIRRDIRIAVMIVVQYLGKTPEGGISPRKACTSEVKRGT